MNNAAVYIARMNGSDDKYVVHYNLINEFTTIIVGRSYDPSAAKSVYLTIIDFALGRDEWRSGHIKTYNIGPYIDIFDIDRVLL
jgi:hypothetical protein